MLWPLAGMVIMGGLLLMFVISTNSIKGKLLVTFHRQNLTKVEKWCSIKDRHVYFGKKDGGKGSYEVNPEHVELMQYNRGLVYRIFPQTVPSIEFRWNTPMSIDPRTSQSSWHTPELRAAAWQEHRAKAFALAAAAQGGKKDRFPAWFLPALTLFMCVVLFYYIYTLSGEVSSMKSYLAGIR